LPLDGFLLVGVGAAREHGFLWDFGICLNPVFATVSLGALRGGFIIGGMMSAADAPGFSPAVRLLVVTDFPGESTTSSTFSAETAASLLQARYRSALAAVLTHVAGSLCMTALGVLLVRAHVGE